MYEITGRDVYDCTIDAMVLAKQMGRNCDSVEVFGVRTDMKDMNKLAETKFIYRIMFLSLLMR